MAGEFTSAYQRTKYWLDLLWPEREKQRQQQAAHDQQAAQDQQRAAEQQQQEASRLNEADFEHGYRYQETERGTFEVQQYPTGRYIGEIRQTDDGSWQTRHR